MVRSLAGWSLCLILIIKFHIAVNASDSVEDVLSGSTQEKLAFSFGVEFPNSKYLIVSDSTYNCIRRISYPLSKDSTISVIAGIPGSRGWMDGPAATSLFNKPEGLAVDTFGNIYVSDKANRAIRKIDPYGLVSTIAGKNETGSSNGNYENDGTFSTDIQGLIFAPNSCDLIIFDEGGRMIRKLKLDSPYSSCNPDNPHFSPPPVTHNSILSVVSQILKNCLLPILFIFLGMPLGAFVRYTLERRSLMSGGSHYSISALFRNDSTTNPRESDPSSSIPRPVVPEEFPSLIDFGQQAVDEHLFASFGEAPVLPWDRRKEPERIQDERALHPHAWILDPEPRIGDRFAFDFTEVSSVDSTSDGSNSSIITKDAINRRNASSFQMDEGISTSESRTRVQD